MTLVAENQTFYSHKIRTFLIPLSLLPNTDIGIKMVRHDMLNIGKIKIMKIR